MNLVGTRIELTLTESFAKHKRNVLLVSAIVFVLALAAPQEVKIPGLGTDMAVTGRVAYLLLGLTLAYFFAAYWVELLAVLARNKEFTAANTVEGIAERLNNAISPLAAEAENLIANMKSMTTGVNEVARMLPSRKLDEKLTQFLQTAEEIRERRGAAAKNDPDENGDIRRDVQDLQGMQTSLTTFIGDIRQLNSFMTNLTNDFSKFIVDFEVSKKSIEENSSSLSLKITKMSERIILPQRIGFRALDQVIPIALFVVAFVICADGGLNQSRFMRAILASEAAPQAVAKASTKG
ncbi:hypothetical protein [Sphingopyxis sp. MSC1_008]|uniref:hypothetical protein n=1 Tax=Sphingopyxis sp. MSC1_008 TaxID=2909265 RepID=UPI0020C0C232|nr:hypothetical protein [Sphingopyxis sp. MSC1_008]